MATAARPIPAKQLDAMLGAELPIDYSPLRPYMRSSVEMSMVTYAENVVISQCMAGFGLQYPIPDFEKFMSSAQLDDHNSTTRIYGVSDKSDAETFGYMPRVAEHPYQPPKAPNGADYNTVFQGSAEFSPQTNMHPGKYNGKQIPPGGCLGSAQKAVEGSVNKTNDDRTTLGQDLFNAGVGASESDPAYLAAVSQWSQCMAKQGYHYTQILEPGSTMPGGRSLDSKPSKGEVQTAVADVGCKDQNGTVGKLQAVAAKYQQQQLDAHRVELDAQKKIIDLELSNAKRMITSGNYGASS